jgi:hypothetical protein
MKLVVVAVIVALNVGAFGFGWVLRVMRRGARRRR